jgi:hypothetical protein
MFIRNEQIKYKKENPLTFDVKGMTLHDDLQTTHFWAVLAKNRKCPALEFAFEL